MSLLVALVLAASPESAVAVHPLAFFQGAVAIEGERQVVRPLSLAVSLGFRPAAGSDYASVSVGGTLEARWWVIGSSPWQPLAACERGGPVVAVRAIFDGNRLTQRSDGRLIGSTLTVGGGVSAGYRQPFACRVMVTPSVGVDLKGDLDLLGRLVPLLKPFLVYGLTIGWAW